MQAAWALSGLGTLTLVGALVCLWVDLRQGKPLNGRALDAAGVLARLTTWAGVFSVLCWFVAVA